jgi:hypothetical protein
VFIFCIQESSISGSKKADNYEIPNQACPEMLNPETISGHHDGSGFGMTNCQPSFSAINQLIEQSQNY